MSQSAPTFFGFWEGVRGSQYQNRLPDGAVVELRQAGAKAKGAAVLPLWGQGQMVSAPSIRLGPPCVDDLAPRDFQPGNNPEDCFGSCRSHDSNLSEFATCLFNCYGGAIEDGPCACPSGDPPYFPMPDFSKVHIVTQLCFAVQFGDAEWPETCCCAPPLNQSTDCSPPSEEDCDRMISMIPCREWTAQDRDVRAAVGTASDQQLFGAAVAILLKNLDVVLWLSCLVQNWSPELKGLNLSQLILQLLTVDESGRLPLTVSYVQRHSIYGAHMWAYTLAGQSDICPMVIRGSRLREPNQEGICRVGIIIPINNINWTRRTAKWQLGGSGAFCAAIQVASELLHEIVHIIGDGYSSGEVGAEDDTLYPTYSGYGADSSHNINEIGAYHERVPDPSDPGDDMDFPIPCWDEARMAGTMFLWAMSQRYTCLTSNTGCGNMDDPMYFAYSTGTLCQLGASCFSSGC